MSLVKNPATKPRKRAPDEYFVKRFMATGSYLEGTVFWRNLEDYTEGLSKLKWYYKCPKCSSDEYAVAGLCSGVFSSLYTHLSKGRLSCRCNTVFRWTQAQREYQIEKTIESEGLPYSFKGWVGGAYKNTSISRILLSCTVHGEWQITVGNFLCQGCRCPGCAKSGFNLHIPAHVYVILAFNNLTEESFTGYGVSNEIDVRRRAHRNQLSKLGFAISEMEIFYFDTGAEALRIERKIQSVFPLTPVAVNGFKTEATYNYHYTDVINLIEKEDNNET